MSDLKLWSDFFEGDELNVVCLDDQSFWFQASKLCAALGYKNTQVAIQTHCEDYEIKKLDIGQYQDVNFISESGFYSLVLGSKKDRAKAFKKWVCSEVLPKLRASGAYIMPTATSTQLLALSSQITVLRDRVEQWENLKLDNIIQQTLCSEHFHNELKHGRGKMTISTLIYCLGLVYAANKSVVEPALDGYEYTYVQEFKKCMNSYRVVYELKPKIQATKQYYFVGNSLRPVVA